MSDQSNLTTLRPGESRVVGGKLWARCRDCNKIGRIDGLFAGLHLCLTDEEIKQQAERQPK